MQLRNLTKRQTTIHKNEKKRKLSTEKYPIKQVMIAGAPEKKNRVENKAPNIHLSSYYLEKKSIPLYHILCIDYVPEIIWFIYGSNSVCIITLIEDLLTRTKSTTVSVIAIHSIHLLMYCCNTSSGMIIPKYSN